MKNKPVCESNFLPKKDFFIFFSGDSRSTLVQLLNGNNDTPRRTTPQPSNPEAIQQQHFDFIKKYKAGKKTSQSSNHHFFLLAKAKLESQLEIARTQETINGGQANDILKRVKTHLFP
jgi:hypothetical protein